MFDKSNWKNGIFGLVTGDALGCPVEFYNREKLKDDPVTDMRGYGTHKQPAGTWTDDSSMVLAALDSMLTADGIDLNDIMENFALWKYRGEYTPWGQVFDMGDNCARAIDSYQYHHDISVCGRRDEHSNGNGSLMRILPVCIYLVQENVPDNIALKTIYDVSSLTHAHERSQAACGIYYFCVKAILFSRSRKRHESLYDMLQEGIDSAFKIIRSDELRYFDSLTDLQHWRLKPEQDIRSDAYVVSTLTSAVWCLINTDSYRSAVLKAVNLGSDSDTTASVAGGLAGLYYGYSCIPKEWIRVLARRRDILKMCRLAETRFPAGRI